MSADLTFQIRRLQKLNQLCGGSSGGKQTSEMDADLSKMTPYEQGQYKLACDMKRCRENILELDNLGEKASITRKTELSNAIRKQVVSLKKDTVEVKKLAAKENKKAEFEQLVGHVKKTEQLYKSRFMKIDEEDGGPVGNAGATRLTSLDGGTEMNDMGAPMVSLRDDEEFQAFFEQTKQNDVKIDQALDRISAGVQRLQENATAIKDELRVQNTLLDETEKKVDDVHNNLRGLNKRLTKTLKEVDKDKMCIYVFCFLLLLGLGGGIYWVIAHKEN